MNPDVMLSLLNYHEDGVTPYMILRMAYKWENVNKLGSDFGASPVVITDRLLLFIHKTLGLMSS